MQTSASTSQINKALFKVQGSIGAIKRNAENEHFSKGKKKATYATWDDMAEVVIEAFQKHGILMEMEEGEVEGYKSISLRLTHVESEEFKVYAPYRIKESSSGNLDHNAGKSTKYAMKQVLVLALGLRGTDEDTDGNDIDPPNNKKNVLIPKRSSEKYESLCPQTDLPLRQSKGIQSEGVQSSEEKRKNAHQRFMIWCRKNGIKDDVRLQTIYNLTRKNSSTLLTIPEMKMVHDELAKEYASSA